MSVDILAELVPELKKINDMLEGIDMPEVERVDNYETQD